MSTHNSLWLFLIGHCDEHLIFIIKSEYPLLNFIKENDFMMFWSIVKTYSPHKFICASVYNTIYLQIDSKSHKGIFNMETNQTV